MDLPGEIETLPLKELERLLFRAGTSLQGKNLRRASWREIARALTRGRARAVVMRLLRAAATRDDAARVLRIARRSRKSTGASRPARAAGRPSVRTGAAITSPVTDAIVDAFDAEDDGWDSWWDHRNGGSWSVCSSGPCCCGIVEVDDRALEAVRQAIDTLSARVYPFEALSTRPDFRRTHSASCDAVRAPIEARLSAHLTWASTALNDEAFIQHASIVMGDQRNLEVIRATARDARCDALAARLCLFAPFWLREPMAWDGEQSLPEHLFARRPVPRFLHAEWTTERAQLKWLCWFVLLGLGASLHRSAPYFSWRIPRRFQQHLVNVPEDVTAVEATIYAEMKRQGGTNVDGRRLVAHGAFVSDCTEQPPRPEADRFWAETVRWLVTNSSAIDDDQARLLLDWAMHEHLESRHDPTPFTWKGRSVQAAVRRANQYHEQKNARHNRRWKARGWDFEIDSWTFVELTTGAALFDEGQALHHCVAGYAPRCVSGRSAIVSLRRNGTRCLTLELNPALLSVVQVRGQNNRPSTREERAVIARWLRERVLDPCDISWWRWI